MGGSEYKIIFSRNLRKYMALHNKEQIDLINDLGFNKSAVSTWCNGTRLPRMDKVQILADYFGIEKSDLIEDKSDKEEPSYYLNEETEQIAQEIFNNPDLKMLFDTTRDCSPEDMKKVISMVKAFKGEL